MYVSKASEWYFDIGRRDQSPSGRRTLHTDPNTPIPDQASGQRGDLFLSSVLARFLPDRQGTALTLKDDRRLEFW